MFSLYGSPAFRIGATRLHRCQKDCSNPLSQGEIFH